MLIKEYRIPLPLSTEEYKVAQLYMIAKKSRDESQSVGNGVEILVNEPYTEGPGGKGQYTHKIYHVGQHLPSWLKALLPKSALTIEERAWNAYPYTRTRYTCPFVEKFFIEIETKYFNDSGHQENVFDLNSLELRNRIVDTIDIVKDQLYGTDYKTEEDPKFYKSEKTARGPLSYNWVADHDTSQDSLANARCQIMCAYKLCKVEFKYWGMQSKIEKFIHESALRKTMLRAHRQAWAWQDEWFDLTMDDIRKIEKEVQEQLARKMAADNDTLDEEDNLESTRNITKSSGSVISAQTVDLNLIDKDKDEEIRNITIDLSKARSSSLLNNTGSKICSKQSFEADHERTAEPSDNNYCSISNSKTNIHSSGEISNFDRQWRIESLANDSDSSSNEEFFDAEEGHLLSKWSSLDCVFGDWDGSCTVNQTGHEDSIFSNSFIHRTQLKHSSKNISNVINRNSIDSSSSTSPVLSPTHQSKCPIHTLIFVLHGGNILDSGAEPMSNKKSDFTTFRVSFENLLRQHYPSLISTIAFRLITIQPLCADALAVLSSLSPYNFQSSPSAIDGLCHSYDAVPIASLPLFAVFSQNYLNCVSNTISSLNSSYNNFLKSEEGQGFSGQIVFISDSIGSIVGFDALCRYNKDTSESYLVNAAQTLSSFDSTKLKSASLASLSPGPNPTISISDESGNEDCNDSPHSSSKRSGSKNAKMTKFKPQSRLDSNEDSSYLNILSSPLFRLNMSDLNRLEFEVSDFFMFGSSLGLVLTFQKMFASNDGNILSIRPNCSQLYNLFHPMDPTVSRIEPLLSARFSLIPPVNVPKYQKFPLGDGYSLSLIDSIQSYVHFFSDLPKNSTCSPTTRRISDSNITETLLPQIVTSIMPKWWGSKRLDYALYCPEGLTNFPTYSLPHLFHASYWESNDVIAFILRQIIRANTVNVGCEKESVSFTPNQMREKWIKKRTSIKLKNIAANHRANDVIAKEGSEKVISARFMYGPLDVVTLAGEKVDIHIMKDLSNGEWTFLSTEITDKTGRVTYKIPSELDLGYGIYPIKLIVRGDNTSIDLFLTIVPPKTECIVFSIDGSFTASVSVTGRDPKVRAGAIDVVRHWQELGYIIIYITGRPDMQEQKVLSWLTQHNFPFGLIYFADRLSTDPLKHKAEYLRHLQRDCDIIVHAAYGSSKDIWVYQNIGLKRDQIYIVGKASKKQQSYARILTEGYAAHLSELTALGGSRPAQGNARMLVPRGASVFTGYAGFTGLRQRRKAKRTNSYPLSSQLPSNQNTPEGILASGVEKGCPNNNFPNESNIFSSFFCNKSGSNKK